MTDYPLNRNLASRFAEATVITKNQPLKFIMTKHSTAQGHTNMIRSLGENALAHNLASLLSQKALRVKTFL